MISFKSISEIKNLISKNNNNIHVILESVIDELESTGKTLDALKFTDKDFAINQANKIKNSDTELPLYGVPLAHKELFQRFIKNGKAWPNEGGSKSRQNVKSHQTAKVISLLDEAGSIDCGRLVSVEYAFGVTGHNDYAGTPKNPWNKNYVCGGSSSGSASIVAAGIIPVALGSDTGGSVRLPASACGLFGIKPTQGLISRDGVFPLSISLDSVGPLSRTVYDAATILQILAVHDDNDHLSVNVKVPNYISEMKRGIKGIKIGLPKNYFLEGSDEGVSLETTKTFSICEKLGAICSDIKIPDIETANDLNMLLISTEAARSHKKVALNKHKDFNQQTLMRILSGVFTNSEEYEKLKKYRISFIKNIITKVFDEVDLFIAPVWPCYIPTIKDSDLGANKEAASLVRRIGHNTRPINYLGLPAISIPTGFDPNGLPLSIQLIGKPFSEALLLRAAYSLEKDLCFWNKRPNI